MPASNYSLTCVTTASGGGEGYVYEVRRTTTSGSAAYTAARHWTGRLARQCRRARRLHDGGLVDHRLVDDGRRRGRRLCGGAALTWRLLVNAYPTTPPTAAPINLSQTPDDGAGATLDARASLPDSGEVGCGKRSEPQRIAAILDKSAHNFVAYVIPKSSYFLGVSDEQVD